MRALVLCLFTLGSLGAASGCDCSGSLDGDRDGAVFDGASPDIEGLRAIRIEPVDAVLVLTNGMPVQQQYTAIGTFEDGTERDVTRNVSWRLRGETAGMGQFAGNLFISGNSTGGRAGVEAQAGDQIGRTTLTVLVRNTVAIPPTSGPALPADPGALFTGAEDPSRAPRLVYPNDGVVLPPNLGRIEIHWLRGPAANTLFEVSFSNEMTDVKAFVRCERPENVQNDGCIWEPSGQVWAWIARTNAGGQPLTIRVRATSDSGGAVGASSTVGVRFAKDELRGTIYYWTVSEGGRIMRYDFGAERDAAERVMGPELTSSNECVGCHALSRDGRKLMGSVGGIDSGGMLLMDLETFQPIANRSGENGVLQFGSFSPDSNTLAGVWGDSNSESFGDLLLFDTRCDAANQATCGRITGRIDLAGREASHPDWSPDGARIAFTDVGQNDSSQRPRHGAISYVERTGAGWSGPMTLVERAGGRNRYNPNYAPNSEFLVFNESVCPNGEIDHRHCNADTDPSATIYAVPANGGMPTALTRAQARGVLDTTSELANTFPRFTPFVFVLDDTSEFGQREIMYVSFSSTRNYGVRVPPQSGNQNESERSTWLWMAAVDPDAALGDADASFPAFALPFQDLATSNHIAVWTTESVGMPPLL